MTKKTETETKNEIEPREDMLPEVYDFEQDAGGGFEDTGREDYAIPMLVLLQGLSPQVQEDGVEGARPGMILNSITDQLYSGKEGVLFVPAHREQAYLEWAPRTQGGGLKGVHSPNSDVVRDAYSRSKEFGDLTTPTGNDLKQTFLMYGLVVDPETGEPESAAVISFSSTKIKSYQKIMTAMKELKVPGRNGRVNPPIFANQLRIKSKHTKNEKGEFFIFDIKPAGNTLKESLLLPVDGKPNPLMVAAKEFAQLVKSGTTKVDHAADANASGFGSTDDDEDIPF